MADLTKLPANPSGSPIFAADRRATDALRFRFGAAQQATLPDAPHPSSVDFAKWPDFSDLYSKGLKQDHPGIVNAPVFKAFIAACGFPALSAPGTANFEDAAIRLGGSAKENGPLGAFALQPVGNDSQSFTVPAPPAVDSNAYAVELVELYWASLLRDLAFTEFHAGNALVKAACDELTTHVADYAGPTEGGKVTPHTLFRGGFRGETVGPHVSQFSIFPTALGAQDIDQKMQTYIANKDFMFALDDWYTVQQGGTPAELITADPVRRHMRSGRSFASFTRVDELYQAYLVAYLVLNTWKVGPNPGSPYSPGIATPFKNQKPFGTFGGPDIASTLGAVAKAALDAVWYQKWVVHLRHRPEAGGGLVHLRKTGASDMPIAADSLGPIILDSAAVHTSFARYGSYLLSQAFPEGSPTHPAYPTGHGTVAGACITVLKFFFNCEQPVCALAQPLVPTPDGLNLVPYTGIDCAAMTISGELHKLAHNVSFGHGIHAGIHWRSDTDQSILLGEAVALAFLQNQAWAYKENFAITLTRIDGSLAVIKNF